MSALKTPNLWRGESDVEIAAALDARFSTLRLAVDNGSRIVRGALNIEHEGQFLAGFQIEVLLDKPDILGLPVVKEVGGRIPRTPAKHVNPADGSACLYLPEDLLLRTTAPLGIVEFLDGPVRNFFLGQACVEAGLPFPFGEWGHGAEGMKEMLFNLLGFEDTAICIAVLELVSGKVVKAHWPCPCKSRRLLRDCHYDLIQRLRRDIPLKKRRFLLARTRELT